MAISYDDITAGSNQTVYNFNFDYIEASDVKVKLNGTDTTAYTLSGAKQVTLDTAPTQGTVVRVYRETNSLTPEKNFVSGSTLKAEELNANFKQALYVTQETTREVAESNAGNVITQVTNAVNTANAASTAATNAENTANGIAATANSALTTANTASTNASTALTNVASKADIGANVSIFANDSNYISKGTNNTLPADIIIDSTQNITTTGTFGSGDITITDQSPRILFTETDSDPDWKVVSVGGEFRIHDETNDEDRVIVNQDGHVDVKSHLDVNGGADVTGNLTVSGNATLNGTCTANSFSGNGSGLTGLNFGNLRQIQEASSTGTSSSSSQSFQTKVQLTVGTASNTRVIVFYSFEHGHSNTSNHSTLTQVTGSNINFVGGTISDYESGTGYHLVNGHVLDTSSHSGNRTYRIQWRKNTSQGNANIRNASLTAVAFNV